MTQDKRREELINDLINYYVRNGEEFVGSTLNIQTCELVASYILAKQDELVERVRDVIAQPPDRIIDPIPVNDYEVIRQKILSILDEIKKG